MKHNHLCLQTSVAVAARESVSQAVTPAIREICAALSAQMFPPGMRSTLIYSCAPTPTPLRIYPLPIHSQFTPQIDT